MFPGPSQCNDFQYFASHHLFLLTSNWISSRSWGCFHSELCQSENLTCNLVSVASIKVILATWTPFLCRKFNFVRQLCSSIKFNYMASILERQSSNSDFWIYSVSQNTLRISIVNYIRLVRRIDLILFLNFWYIYEILFFTLLLIIGGLQAKLY